MDTDEQHIRELIAAWIEASRQGDLQRVLSLMSEDAVFLVAGQSPMRGKAGFEAAFRAMPTGMKFEAKSEIQEIRVAGDIAWCWTHLSVTMMPPGKEPVRRSGNTLSVLQKQTDGRWLLIRDANLLASTPSVGR